jgi:hypothetical protein
MYARLALAGSAAGGSQASGRLAVVMIITGTAAAASAADGNIGLPFVAGALPDKITAIVFVTDDMRAAVSVIKSTGNVMVESINAEVT